MSVPNQTPYIIYNANGLTTVFPFEFYIISAGDIQVSINGTVVITGYTVSGAGNVSGGDVVFITPPAAGSVVMLERIVPTYRLTDYQDNGDLLADTVNKDFDRLWMAIQRAFIYLGLALKRPLFGGPFDAEGYRIEGLADPVNEADATNKRWVINQGRANLSRTVRVPEGLIPPLPSIAQRKNKIVAMDDNGDPIMVIPGGGDASDVMIELAKNYGINCIGSSGIYAYIANGIDDSNGIQIASENAVSRSAQLKIIGVPKVVSPTTIDAQIAYTEKQIFTIDSKITLNGKYALPDWFGDAKGAVDAAINAMPLGGGIIHCLNKKYKENGYTFGATSKFIGKDNIWIRGSGNPRTSSDYKSLESGTVLQGTYLVWANNFTITDCGIDSGFDFVGSEYGGTPVIGLTEGLLFTYPDSSRQESWGVKTGLRVKNVTTLAYNSTFPVHSFIASEGYTGSAIENVRAVMGYHGFVVKGMGNSFGDILVECAGGNAVILKSEWASSPVGDVIFNSIKCHGAGVPGSTPHDIAPVGGVACNLDLHGYPMDGVTIPYIESTGYTLGVRAYGQGEAVNIDIGKISFTARDIGQGAAFQVVNTDSKTTFNINHIAAASCGTLISTGDVATNINLNSFEAARVGTITDTQGGTTVNICSGVYENVTDGLWRINGNSRVRCGMITARGYLANEFASGGLKFNLVNGWTEISSSPFSVSLRGGGVVLNGLIRSGASSTAVDYPGGFAPVAAIRKATITKRLSDGQTFGTLSVIPEKFSVLANEFGDIEASSDYISVALEWSY